MHEALLHACARAGVARDYHDVFGHHIEVPPARLAALLHQLGWGDHAPGDGGAWHHEIEQREDAAWRRALPPVQVVAAGAGGFALRVRWPHDAPPRGWTLQGEDGRLLGSGRLVPHEGAEQGRRPVDGVERIERLHPLAAELPPGYHRLTLEGEPGHLLLIAAPEHCHLPPEGERSWGIAVQLYALRSDRQWGMGDFSDLAALVPVAAQLGAQAIGLNPLHALFLDDPGQCSPYSPSSRRHLNALYIDVEALPEFAACEAARRHVAEPAFQQRLAALRASEFVNHPGVAAAKLEVLALLHRHFSEGADAGRAEAFAAFRAARGEALQRQALFDALYAHFRRQDAAAWGWPAWPPEYHDPDSPAVAGFARTQAPQVAFYAWLQWVADEQLQAVAARCREAGLRIGLYQDLAVSVDRHGADAWSARAVLAAQASVGAPPDALGPLGQDWGLPPLAPERLRESGYRLFIDSLRACMRGAGALRIDHVMGLTRLFCMPPGATPAEGAYVHYPAEEMLSIVALESQRHGCVVIGEDLGTVADATRALLARFRLLSYRLLYFERHGGGFKRPGEYPQDALAAIGTHDLATLQGWWAGADLHTRVRLGLLPNAHAGWQQLHERAAERVQLMAALDEEGLQGLEGAARALGEGTLGTATAAAIHAYLARAPARLMMVQAEDLLAQQAQANVPGTVDEHPNWRRRLALPADRWLADARVQAIAAAVRAERP
ncbi:MAG: 4-alpha-glucanotransferase [Xenophilus sp.]